MPEKPRNTRNAPSAKAKSGNTSERRKQIFAIVLMVIGVISFLSILNYSKADEVFLDKLSPIDVFRLPFNDTVKSLAGGLHNHLGLIGALIADFFVNSTVGYAGLMFPVLMVVWGWVFLRKISFRAPLTFTNYAIVFGLLFSSTAGITNLILGNVDKEWSGVIGAFLADVSTKLLGKVGASIIVVTSLFITMVLAIDLDIHKSIDRFKALWQMVFSRTSREDDSSYIKPAMIDDLENEVTIHKNQEEYEAEDDIGPVQFGEEEVESESQPDKLNGESVKPKFQIQTAESVGESDPPPSEPVRPIENELEEIDYVFPSIDLLDAPRQADAIPEEELKANAELVRAKLANFGVEIESVSVMPGPVVTLYELVPASGVKISRIVSLSDDLALALAAKGIRIIAPIPGKSAVGVEIPNRNPSTVHLRSVLNSTKFRESRASLPIALGKTIAGDVLMDDLAKMPHLLIAGSTGSGKSVGINTLLASLLFKLHPSDVKFVIIDPKKIELAQYGKLKYHFLAVSPDTNQEIITTPESAVSALKGVEMEMEKRYDRLAAAGVRNILDYNERVKSGRVKDAGAFVHRKLPYLIVVIDELADLMITAAKEVEEPIARLAQLARAVGIHLVLATQRPSVDVITGVIKANFPARIAYQVATKTDSRTILDMNGAEQLLGSGDMLYLPSGSPKPVRIQNAFISSDEVERLTDHIAKQQGYSKPFSLPSITEKKREGLHGMSENRDEFFEEAARLIVRHQQGSVSLLQRRLKVGYSRAARIVDELEAAGIVGPFDGSKARLVLVDSDDQLDRILETL